MYLFHSTHVTVSDYNRYYNTSLDTLFFKQWIGTIDNFGLMRDPLYIIYVDALRLENSRQPLAH